ncbi:hypothetical protein [Streptomyces sp. NPDC002328]|uniref:hypothetical protein n=1 Tax=Streptomyces sp. NPDC002328 TaxID=3364642 RepID=UPI0036849C71
MDRERPLRRVAVGARPVRALMTLLAGFALLLGFSASPAVATEGSWINEGGAARSPDAMNATWFAGDLYEILRGNDNQIWWRYRNGEWRVHPGAGITRHRPEIVVIHNTNGADRLAALHVGTTGEVYYSFLGGAAGNVWTGWARIPGTANANSYVSAATGNDEGPSTLATTTGNRLIVQTMQLNGSSLTMRSGWTEWFAGTVEPGVDIIQNHPYVKAPVRDIKTYIAHRSGHRALVLGYRSADLAEFRTTPAQEFPGGGQCEDIAFGRGGPSVPDISDLFSFNNYTVACTSPNDGRLWVNRSTTAGTSWSGWAPTTNGSAYPNSAPEVHGSPGGEVFADISWGGPEGNGISQRMILMKQVQ